MQAGQLFRKHKRKTSSGVHTWKNRKAFLYIVTPLPSFSFLYPLFLLWMLFEGCLGLHLHLRGKVRTTSQNNIKDASMTGDGGDGTCLGENKTPDLGLNSHLESEVREVLGTTFGQSALP